ncbi:MAG TPA: response regulator, partial [Candidatus Wallbacteria bacterium]|nr:response regulator [Candidatus Wallbacteria bacterium]
EDDRISQLLIKTISEEYGWDVRIARNGIEAMDYFQSEKFDIILMDGQMPEMDGFETTIAIRKMEISTSRKRTPIIAMTAYVMPEDRQKCISSGMDDYVSKPVDPDEFIDKIKKILG